MTKRIDIDAISSQPEARLRFLEQFVGFGEDDWAAVKESAGVLAPRLEAIVDALYDHLLGFDDTRRIFASSGSVDPDYLAARKRHLIGWVCMTAAAGPDTRRDFANYLNVVGRRHTGIAGEPSRVVPPRYLIALTSFVQSTLTAAFFELLPDEPQRALRYSIAWNKMVVMQLEMFLKNVAPQWPRWDEPGIYDGTLPHDAPTLRLV